MNETETKPEENPVAEQSTYEIDGFKLPGLAFEPDTDKVTIASFVDLLIICLAFVDHPKVNEILKKNNVILKDKDGKIVFPKPTQ